MHARESENPVLQVVVARNGSWRLGGFWGLRRTSESDPELVVFVVIVVVVVVAVVVIGGCQLSSVARCWVVLGHRGLSVGSAAARLVRSQINPDVDAYSEGRFTEAV